MILKPGWLVGWLDGTRWGLGCLLGASVGREGEGLFVGVVREVWVGGVEWMGV